MRRDFVPEGRTPDPDLPRHARDYYPEGAAPRGFGQRVADWVPASGKAPEPPEPEDPKAPLNVPQEAPLLENDFVPGGTEYAPEERLPLGFVVDQTEDGKVLVVAGYDKRGRMLVREQEAEEETPAEEAGAKGGESPEPQAEEEHDEQPAPKRSHKKKPAAEAGE